LAMASILQRGVKKRCERFVPGGDAGTATRISSVEMPFSGAYYMSTITRQYCATQ